MNRPGSLLISFDGTPQSTWSHHERVSPIVWPSWSPTTRTSTALGCEAGFAAKSSFCRRPVASFAHSIGRSGYFTRKRRLPHRLTTDSQHFASILECLSAKTSSMMPWPTPGQQWPFIGQWPQFPCQLDWPLEVSGQFLSTVFSCSTR